MNKMLGLLALLCIVVSNSYSQENIPVIIIDETDLVKAEDVSPLKAQLDKQVPVVSKCVGLVANKPDGTIKKQHKSVDDNNRPAYIKHSKEYKIDQDVDHENEVDLLETFEE